MSSPAKGEKRMDNQRREVLRILARLIIKKHKNTFQATGNEQLPSSHISSVNVDQTLTDNSQNDSEWQDEA